MTFSAKHLCTLHTGSYTPLPGLTIFFKRGRIIFSIKIVTKQKKPSPWLIFGKWKDLKTSSNRNTFDDSSFILGIEGDIFPCWRIDQRKSHFYTKRADIIFTCCRDSVLTMEQPFNCTWFVEGDFLVWQTMAGRACGRILITSTSCTVFIKITHKIWTCHIFNRVKDMLDMNTVMWSVFTCQALHPLGTVW